MGGGASYAVVGEAFSGHHFGIIQIAPVDHDGILQFLAEPVEIEVGEFLPLGKDQQGIRAVSRFISGVGETDVRTG